MARETRFYVFFATLGYLPSFFSNDFFQDLSDVEVVQPHGTHVTKSGGKSHLHLTYTNLQSEHCFVALKPSLAPRVGCYTWKVTINVLPRIQWVFLGVVGNLSAADNSRSDATSYGWDGTSGFNRGREIGLGRGCGFVQGEELYFRLANKTLTQYSVQKGRMFIIDDVSIPEMYLHFNFYTPSTQVTLGLLTAEEQETFDSKLAGA